MTVVRLVSVNVGLPAVIGTRQGRPVHSGIGKRPVAGTETLKLGELNLEGDRQADLSVHGGAEKAVYAYASDHLPSWRAELLRPDIGVGFFGENLSTEGLIESDVAIGDVWAWGDALLQVAQPRWPCFKLTMRPLPGQRPDGLVPEGPARRRSPRRRTDHGDRASPRRRHHPRRPPRRPPPRSRGSDRAGAGRPRPLP